jgi:hypothetical protein
MALPALYFSWKPNNHRLGNEGIFQKKGQIFTGPKLLSAGKE